MQRISTLNQNRTYKLLHFTQNVSHSTLHNLSPSCSVTSISKHNNQVDHHNLVRMHKYTYSEVVKLIKKLIIHVSSSHA